MANAEDELSAESVKSFIFLNGGKVRNVDIVSHYSYFLKHPHDKGTYKKKFSQIVNEVATLKQIEGEKYLVLKKKYKKEVEKLTFYPPPVEVDAPVEEAPREELRERKVGRLHNAGEFLNGSGNEGHRGYQSDSLAYNRDKLPTFQTFQPQSVQNNNSTNQEFQEKKETEHHESQQAGYIGGGSLEMDPNLQDAYEQIEKFERNYMSSAEEQENTRNIDLEVKNEAAHVKNSGSQSENVYQEGDALNDTQKIQVQGATQKNSQDSMVIKPNSVPAPHQPPIPKITTPESESSSTEHHDYDEEPPRSETAESIVSSESMDEHPSPAKDHSEDTDVIDGSNKPTGKLGPLERKWMLACAFGKIAELNDLLKQDPTLITRRDFISGFTVMHWGAKLGKKEMIRMAVTQGVDVNMRTQGGYTALHIAAMHNKEAIMQLLINDFDANIEIRDYSGRKPHHHLKSTASSYIKSKLDSPSSTLEREDGLTRSGSFKTSSKDHAIPRRHSLHDKDNPPTPFSSRVSRALRTASVYFKRNSTVDPPV